MTPPLEDLVAGVDVATGDVRVAVADSEGHVRAFATESLPEQSRPRDGWSEQDPQAWWPCVASALRGVTEELGPDRERIVSLAVSATSGTVMVADDDGQPVGPALMYDDQRASAQAEKAQEAGSRRWESLGLRVSASFGLPKWAWLLEQPEVAARASRVWHVPDLVLARLTGEPQPTDTSHALKSGYDPLRHEWAEEALEALGVPAELLPEVATPTAVVGSVSDDASSETGVPAGCQVRLGMTDSCASQVAAGADHPGSYVSVLGTTLALKGASEDLLHDPTGAVYSHRHPDGWWLPGGASNTGGAALAELFPDADLASMDRQAAEHGPAGCVSYPLTGRGERFPFVQPEARGFCDGTPQSDVERYRATLEGVAFLERLAYAHLSHLGAPPEQSVVVAGAASRSQVWNQVRATALGLPLLVPARAETSFGACILAATGSIHETLSDASAAMVRLEGQVDPSDEERERLDENYRRFVAALQERGWIDDDAGWALDAPASRPRPGRGEEEA